MPYTVEYNQEANCIMVAVDGELDLSVLQPIAIEVSRIAKKTGCKRILNDLRHAKPTRSTIDIYDMPKEARRLGIMQAYKRALVVAEETRDFYFLETVFMNQGHQVRMFTNFDNAKAWLFDDQALDE